MSAGCDCATRTVRTADGPILVECFGAFDRRLIDTLSSVEIVGSTVGRDGTEEGRAGAGVECSERLHDIVLDQGVTSPTVHSEVTVAIGAVVGGVADGTKEGEETSGGGNGTDLSTDRADPGFHPFPPTKFPLFPDQVTLYWPPAPLVYVTWPALSVQNE